MPDAVWFAAPGVAEIRSEAPQQIGPTDVRVRAVVSGLSAGSELLVYRGLAPSDLPPDLPTVAGDFRLPVKFGYANVGTVVETGADVAGLEVDDVVFAHHPHQTEYVVPADFPLRLPKGLPADRGVLAANLETAATVVMDAHPRLDEAVLVVGQGVVGLLVTMLLKRTGARPVIAVDLHARRRDAAIRAGADHALEPGDRLVSEVSELTDGRGVDVAIEASGSPAALQSCVDAAAFGGTVVVASWYGSREVNVALGGAFHRRRLRIISSQVSTLDPSLSPRWSRERRTNLVRSLLTEITLEDLISHRFPFDAAASAYELLEAKPEECLQVVLDYV
jgi:2-desacetyl-2-hydroxyethyl bacteriochlorophyllide A dehydrogenase